MDCRSKCLFVSARSRKTNIRLNKFADESRLLMNAVELSAEGNSDSVEFSLLEYTRSVTDIFGLGGRGKDQNRHHWVHGTPRSSF